MLVIGGGYSKLKVYVHVQERGEGGERGLRLRNLSVPILWMSPLFKDLIQAKCVYVCQG